MKKQFEVVPQPLYPTLDSLNQVIALVESSIPKKHQNEVIGLLMTYHNTLLKLIG